MALVACSSSDGIAPKESSTVSLSFAAARAPAGASRSLGMAGASFSSAPGDTVVLTKVQFVLSHIELAQIDSACTATASVDEENEKEHEGECDELKLAPVLVDVPLTTSAKTAITATVPPGQYRSLHARIDALKAGSKQVGAAEFLAAHKDFEGTSLRVEGTYAGKPFVYTTDAKAEIFVPFNPPIVVTASTAPNVTVAVDPSNWFKTDNGTTIDPTTVGQGQPNNRAIAANIRRSFRVFRDDDRDGRGDHESEGQN
ncbi:MAG: hypothetical protein JWL95_1771 [Gemmatimonadetes bacterium]|nr:hypothetical protein [Gemmatimonadota bacterium]